MQNKKYFLGLILFVLFFFIKIDSVFAKTSYCYNALNSTCESSNDGCTGIGQECAKGCNATKDGCATTTTDTYKCCVNKGDPSKCKDYTTAADCTGGTPNANACSSISTCQQYSGTTTTTTTTTTNFTNPLTYDSISGLLTGLLTSLRGFVVILALIFIVIGGMLYIMSAGDPGMIKRAKNCWLFSVIGLAIVVAAPTFLKQVYNILGATASGEVTKAKDIQTIAKSVLNFLLSIIGIIAIISLVISGGMYMTAYGNEKQLTTAKDIAKWAIVGILVALSSLTLLQQVSKLITG